MAQTHILGYPRIGARRELKFALEAFWRGEVDAAHLEGVARHLRAQNLAGQGAAGLAWRTVGDFAFYDPMLATTALLGCLPARFGFAAKSLTLAQQFELARGNRDQPALEMTKWFDTNYHYLVPELDAHSTFDGGADDWFAQIEEARVYSTQVKPVLIGPVTYLHLAKTHQPGFDRLALLNGLVAGYRRILARAAELGVTWLQIDEPVLGLDLDARWLAAFDRAYAGLRGAGPRLLLTTYFADASAHAARVAALPVDGVHVDLVAAPGQLDAWLATLPEGRALSAGVVSGRNIWRTDLRAALAMLRPLQQLLGDRLWVGTSCSLAHVPVSLEGERRIDPELRGWLAFADEKMAEIRTLGRALAHGEAAAGDAFAASDAALASRRASARVTDPAVRARMAQVTPALAGRARPFAERIVAQHARLKLPPFPTTTIGSFPQTPEIRQLRAARHRGEVDEATYEAGMRAQIRVAVEHQEACGLDVLVHGEPERNDMVEYFGERLAGYAFTENGWVQSYGSRCVKPPVIYGDVSRPAPMTVAWTRYAQSFTDKPMKGMLTGPVTLLQWSFVRDDQPRSDTCLQIALALRDEVRDLEAAGTPVIQIDEPAFREGLPLKRGEWDGYLSWAVRAFRIASSGVADATQIHTHMCYAEFNDILPAIAALDADVITIETSRSAMELLEGFRDFRYPNEIGPGVYDIHSPRVPTVEAMVALLEKAAALVPAGRLWVNPDCGLKTRGWPEVDAALANMVAAARAMRARVAVR